MDGTPRTEILEATHRSLCTHGYADLTLDKIATETDTSKSLICYHYETKQALFSAFLDYLYEQYTTLLSSVEGRTPPQELEALLEVVLTPRDGRPTLQQALVELTIQAHHDDSLQSRLVDFETALVERLQKIIDAGIESGGFDPELESKVAAELLATTIMGAHMRQTVSDRSVDHLKRTLMSYIEEHFLAAEAVEAR